MDNRTCETCRCFDYDEELDEYVCRMDLDEDEAVRFLSCGKNECPFYREREQEDEY